MEDVLRGLQWEECLLYMDDIIVPGASFQESLLRIEHVFIRLREANLKLKPSKCILLQKSVKFLGHVVSEEGVHTDPDKIVAVQNWSTPRNDKEIKSFLGLCSYYRKFVKGFADIARPLHKACQKGTKFVWSEECGKSFEALKQELVFPPILIYPVPGKQFIIDTDASHFAVGAVLSQEVDGREHVIAYMSKALNKHETSYCTTRKELLAVIVAIKNFHPYVYGQNVLLRTDNSAVSWMQSLKNPTGQVARWLQQLATYNLQVIHRAGKRHTNADALSRNPCRACRRQEELNQTECEQTNEENNTVEECTSENERTQAKMQNPGEHQSRNQTENKISDTNKGHQSCGKYQQDTEIRAITRSEQNKHIEKLKRTQFILSG
jgi:hypothetical protein